MNVLVAMAGAAAAAAVAIRAAHGGRPRRAGERPPRPVWASEPTVPPAVAEARSLELLRSVVNEDEWRMFRELGFLCVTGRRRRMDGSEGAPRYRYLIYPHQPLVALLPRSLAPVREYCIQFPDPGTGGDGMLPTGDDLVAKWMTVRSDEAHLLAHANVCNAGCQIPLSRIEQDVRRYVRWRERHGGLRRDTAAFVG